MAQQFTVNVLGSKKRGNIASTAMSFSPTRIRTEARAGFGGALGATATASVIIEYPNGSQSAPNEYYVAETVAALIVLANA